MPVYRMMYTKEGPARYISHLDLLRTIERSVRRAGLPIAFTSGFNPHPKIAFAAPLAVGTAGEAEFADLELAGEIPATSVQRDLSGTLPEGLRLLEVRQVEAQTPALMSMVERATYRAEARLNDQLSKDTLDRAIKVFLDQPEILVQRKNKAGERKIYDIRPGIFDMSGRVDNDIIIIETELKTGSRDNIRLEEVMDAFSANSQLPLQGKFVLYRTGLYPAVEKADKTLW
ncbi:MAG: TIGR03936 family radical SAM-associated protein [Desulfotomaculaceae bacterium]|nr:TIGR03936 family radical SAM-associated protein [Desulfotomaculaceae bacterium]